MNITVNCQGVNRAKRQAPCPAPDPKPYNVYEDGEGNHFVLTAERLSGQIFWALKLGAPLSVSLLSRANIERLHFIGRASLQT